jgi:hypothetical protein
MTREILLTQGQVALVDDEDYLRLGHLCWQAVLLRGHWYARRTIAAGRLGGEKRWKTEYLHRAVLRAPEGLLVDHIDPERTLDNRKCNLRLATRAQNAANSPGQRGRRVHAPEYKGVKRCGGRWLARLRGEYLGSFATPEEAAACYNEAAVAEWGEFAWLNPLPEEEEGE